MQSHTPDAPHTDGDKESSMMPRMLVVILIVIVAGALIMGAYYSRQSQKYKAELTELRSASSGASAEEIAEVVKQVGSHITLPADEEPTLATVTDAEKLSENAFFKNALNGDKVLIYAQARKAYLYRPDEDKIIEVATVNLNPEDTNTSSDQPKE